MERIAFSVSAWPGDFSPLPMSASSVMGLASAGFDGCGVVAMVLLKSCGHFASLAMLAVALHARRAGEWRLLQHLLLQGYIWLQKAGRTSAKSCIISIQLLTTTLLLQEAAMGNSLHNKIRLGRASALSSRGVQAGLAVVAFVSMGAAWFVIQALKH